MYHRLILFPQVPCYFIHTKQIYARGVNGLRDNGDIAAKPTGINHINGPFIFVQYGNNMWETKAIQKDSLINIKIELIH